MRTLLESQEPDAKLAVDLFVYRIRRELGSLAAALGGLDRSSSLGESAKTQQRFENECASMQRGWASNWTLREMPTANHESAPHRAGSPHGSSRRMKN